MVFVGFDLLSVCARKQIFSMLGCHSSQKLLYCWTEPAMSGRVSLGWGGLEAEERSWSFTWRSLQWRDQEVGEIFC